MEKVFRIFMLAVSNRPIVPVLGLCYEDVFTNNCRSVYESKALIRIAEK